ncbi:chloramphenicol resistance protein [Ophiostoma piceae UAMH 11346]|uniref:Chloramphenicol resistance protein n=1 Tax=Ophiostoma piceae (strain UAMH 11346) TaxID=1262450 RepID=S3CF69_OPHP1|nr:chloramphenicol resistance protein [Ophiostoma piceae UAMH 11346]
MSRLEPSTQTPSSPDVAVSSGSGLPCLGAGDGPSSPIILSEKTNATDPTTTATAATTPTGPGYASITPDGNAVIAADDDADPELGRVISGPVYSVFSKGMKRYILIIVTITSFISPMTANIYFPALQPIATDLGVSIGLINLTLTTYMICQGIAPTLFGDFGDMAGRRPAFLIALVVYLIVNIGLALQDSYAALLVLRMLQSTGSSGTLALGYAVVADISVSAERGKYMGIVGAGIQIGPTISPVLGGILSQYLGWRSIFWFCCIFSACLLVPYALSVPETARNVVGNGSIRPRPFNMTVLDIIRQKKHPTAGPPAPRKKLYFPNPLRTLYIVAEKDISLILSYTALLYVVFMMIVATLSTLFTDIYHLSDLQIGLCYLPYGVGCCVATLAQGHILDWNYRRTARRIGFKIDFRRGDDLAHFPIERARLEPMLPLLVGSVFTVIAYGWVLEYELPLAVPLVLLFFVGINVVGSFSIMSTLTMDLYPESPATAIAAVNLVRCLLGAGVMAFIEAMIVRLGRGWNFTFWGLSVVLLSPTMWIVLRRGPQWREERRVRLTKKKAQKEQEEEAQQQDLREQGGSVEAAVREEGGCVGTIGAGEGARETRTSPPQPAHHGKDAPRD